MYAQLESCVLTPQGLTEYFKCTVGTRQGCMISPLIFITVMAQLDELLRYCMYFADDVCNLSDTVLRLQKQLNILKSFCENYGIKVNTEKTKIIVFRRGGQLRHYETWTYDNYPIEVFTNI